ncbi:MAG: hypothetical protein KAT09_08305, partial [Candidatus Aegiribacteria sp.]|nr:hypothetical protein [Candidatus Aegiribacteria sp.]
VLITPGEDDETWILRLTDDMDAIIESQDGAILKFIDLRDLGIFPVDSDGCYLLSIKYLDQGQIEVGSFLIHFGFIIPPEKEAKPKEKKTKAKKEEKEKTDSRVLRITIEEPDGKRELVPNAGLMTIGEAEYNTVSAKNVGLPRIHTLLEPYDNKYLLRLIPGIKGGVEVKGSVLPFHTLIERNLMQHDKSDDSFTWIFDKNVSGVFTLGDIEIFFNFIEPPKVEKKPEPKPEIPRKKYIAPEYNWEDFAARPHDGLAMKGNREESNKIAIILGLGLAVALLTGAVFDRFITVVHETKEQKLRSAPTARVATLASQPSRAEGIGEEIITDMNMGDEIVEVGSGGGGPAGGGDASSGVSNGQAAGQAVLQSIGFAAYGTGGTGGSAGIATDLQAAAATGAGLSSGGAGEAVIAGASGGGSGGISGLVGSGGSPSASIEGVSSSEVEAVHRAAEVSFSTHSSSSEIGVQGRSMNDIRRKINMINMRIKRAYEDLLRSNPSAAGTINVTFSITPSGSVVGVSVSAPGNLSSLTASVQAAVQSLNFGPSSEQIENIPTGVTLNLIPPE